MCNGFSPSLSCRTKLSTKKQGTTAFTLPELDLIMKQVQNDVKSNREGQSNYAIENSNYSCGSSGYCGLPKKTTPEHRLNLSLGYRSDPALEKPILQYQIPLKIDKTFSSNNRKYKQPEIYISSQKPKMNEPTNDKIYPESKSERSSLPAVINRDFTSIPKGIQPKIMISYDFPKFSPTNLTTLIA